MATVTSRRREFLDMTDKVMFTALRRVAMQHVTEVKRTMRESTPSGRIYPSRRPGGGLHQASAPGEPPAIDTKNLINHAGVEMRRYGGGEWEALAGYSEEAPYGAMLEFGTARIAPRPVWGPTLPLALAEGNRILKEAGSEVTASGDLVRFRVGG